MKRGHMRRSILSDFSVGNWTHQNATFKWLQWLYSKWGPWRCVFKSVSLIFSYFIICSTPVTLTRPWHNDKTLIDSRQHMQIVGMQRHTLLTPWRSSWSCLHHQSGGVIPSWCISILWKLKKNKDAQDHIGNAIWNIVQSIYLQYNKAPVVMYRTACQVSFFKSLLWLFDAFYCSNKVVRKSSRQCCMYAKNS